ncbi:hypothetical protein E2C01_095707 [Portunus trituberculatus]|uniref:Uncharacterized protein n=1 Tax=Portunus trituberculatus TaxID=210409 RepID=A0A5B7K116_PORTR|nr:hypothetical protein [Portunus trituberculatus]
MEAAAAAATVAATAAASSFPGIDMEQQRVDGIAHVQRIMEEYCRTARSSCLSLLVSAEQCLQNFPMMVL